MTTYLPTPAFNELCDLIVKRRQLGIRHTRERTEQARKPCTLADKLILRAKPKAELAEINARIEQLKQSRE